MVQINFAQKEIQCKIVYYGPGMSGKTTNLELVHGKVPDESRGELTSIATTGERTLYFDYMPLDLGQIAGIRTKFQLYTVPGQIYYKSTRRLVLQGVDGIVFVADSSAAKLRENKESLADLEENLKEMGKTITDIPVVIQYNKRDLPDAMAIADLDREVNVHGLKTFEAVASLGEGVFPTLKSLAAQVLEKVNKGGLAGARQPAPRPASVKAAAPTPKAEEEQPARQPAMASAVAAASAAVEASEAGHAPASSRSTGAPRPGPERRRVTAPPVKAPPPPPSSRVQARPMQDRMVSVRGYGGKSRTPVLAVLALGALIAGAVFFVLSKV